MKFLKGVSPLVAVVMLIAFTLLVAGILGGLITQFAQEQRAIIQYCTGARALLLSGVHAANDANPDLSDVTFSIHNFGDVDLTFNVLQTHLNGTVSKVPASIAIQAGDVGQLTITNKDLNASSEFTIQSQECAGAQDFIRVSDLKSV